MRQLLKELLVYTIAFVGIPAAMVICLALISGCAEESSAAAPKEREGCPFSGCEDLWNSHHGGVWCWWFKETESSLVDMTSNLTDYSVLRIMEEREKRGYTLITTTSDRGGHSTNRGSVVYSRVSLFWRKP